MSDEADVQTIRRELQAAGDDYASTGHVAACQEILVALEALDSLDARLRAQEEELGRLRAQIAEGDAA